MSADIRETIERITDHCAKHERSGRAQFSIEGIHRLLEHIAELEGRTDKAGLSEWAGWDQAREPWGEIKHKDAVLEALFRGPWSVEDAAALIGFIDRTWTRRPSSPGGRDNG